MFSLKIVVLSAFILSPIFLNGKNLNNKVEKEFSIGICFSPDYAYRQFSETNWLTNLRNELEDPRMGYTTGINVKYQFSKRVALIFGLQFSDKGYKNEGSKDDFDVLDFISTDDYSIPEKFNFIYSHHYLGIPLKFNYYFFQRKTKLFFTIGCSLDFFLDGKSKTKLEFEDRIQTYSNDIEGDFNKMSFVGITGLGIETDVSSFFTFRFEPVFRYSLTPDINKSLKQHFYSFGANMVLLCNF